jgi:hypothetical protein
LRAETADRSFAAVRFRTPPAPDPASVSNKTLKSLNFGEWSGRRILIEP